MGPWYHAPHVLFPGMGEHSRDPMYVAFHGLPNQEEVQGSLWIQTGVTGVSIQNVANYTGNPEDGYHFSADLSVSEACVETDTCAANVIDLRIEEAAIPPSWSVKPDFYIPVPFSPQVVNYLQATATAYDDTTANPKPGAITFTPTMVLPHTTDVFPSAVIPAGRFAYVTIQGGAVASLDTSPPNPGEDPDTTGGEERFQQSAHIDLAVIAAGDLKLDLLAGDGDGTLQDKRVRDTGGSFTSRAICAADFDLDGDIDLAVANEYGASAEDQAEVKIFWGDGTPDGYTDSDVYELDPLDKPAAIAAGDMDGDGAPDLLITDGDASDSDHDDLTLLMNGIRINQGFSSGVGFDLGGGDFRAIVTGSFEDDDDLDVVVANYQDDRVTVLTGAGNGSFDGAHHVTVGDGPVDLVVGDFSQSDAEEDLAVLNAGSRTVSILQGDHGETALFTVVGTLTLPVSSDYAPVAIVTGPFNGSVDERMDLAILLDNTQPNSADKLLVYYANGDYTFTSSPQEIALPTDCDPTDLVTGTFNQDNHPDVAVSCSGPTPNEVKVYRGGLDGTGGFYLTHTEEADSGVAAMTVEQFDTQYKDFIYLPEGRNAGYGAVIWSHPLDQYGQPTSGTRHFLFVSNHTVDPDSVGDFEDCQIEGEDVLDEETGIPVGHTVSVYEINPEPFAPTSWRTTNDMLMATLDMDVSGGRRERAAGRRGWRSTPIRARMITCTWPTPTRAR